MNPEKRVYLRTTPSAHYRVTRTINTLEVEPGDIITKDRTNELMKNHKVIIDPPKKT